MSVQDESKTEVPEFAGNTYLLRFDGGVVYRNTYSPDGTELTWLVVAGDEEGRSGHEELVHDEIGERRYFVNWIEETGTTVSHVFDVGRGRVRAYVTLRDTDGVRRGRLLRGTVERLAG